MCKILFCFLFTSHLLCSAETPCSLVTGGAGFIGSHVARELINRGHRVIVLDDLSGGFEENIPSEALFIRGSILNHELLKKIFSEYHFDYVYHLAAYAAEGLSHFIKRFNYANNLIGSVNLINEAVKHKVKCFVFTSSIAVYGSADPPCSEETIPTPKDPYGIAKWSVEQELHITQEFFGLNFVIFRPHNVYGELQNLGDRYRNVIGIFMNQLMQNKPLSVFGDGMQTRAFSYIGDIAPMIASCVNVPSAYNQTFNIGSEARHTIQELAQEVQIAMGIKGEILHLPPRNETVHAYSDHSKAKTTFPNYRTTSLKEGLAKMAKWAKKTGIKCNKTFDEIEIDEKIPSFWVETKKE